MRLSVHPFLIKYRQLNKSTYLQNIFQIIQTFILAWTKTVSLRLFSITVCRKFHRSHCWKKKSRGTAEGQDGPSLGSFIPTSRALLTILAARVTRSAKNYFHQVTCLLYSYKYQS